MTSTHRSAHVPAGLTESQLVSLRALRASDEMQTPTHDSSLPSSIYLSEERFSAELQRIFRSVALPVAASALLPQPDQAVPVDGYGVPLLLTRDHQGRARVFVNACRHRGAKLLTCSDVLRTRRVTCQYHAWSYKLDGTLIGVPRPETFPSIDRAQLGLTELWSREAGGIIWAGLDPKSTPAVLDGSEDIYADFEAFGLQNMHVYAHDTYDLAANWKLVVEPFLEPYHVQRLHSKSIAKLFADVPSVCTRFGHHLRQASGKAHFDPAVLDGNLATLHKHVTHSYLVFPNLVLITSPYYISVMIVMPRGLKRTTVEYYMLINEAPRTEKAEDLHRRSHELITKVFGEEDFRAALLQQEGLDSGAIDRVYLGGLEEMIPPFHASVDSFLKD